MNFEPEKWAEHVASIKGRELLSKLTVTNDVAERGVALMTQYNKLVTKNEKEKQNLLFIVQDNRQSIPDMKKSTLSGKMRVE